MSPSDEQAGLDTAAVPASMVEHAVLAPSSHNTQPWRLLVPDGRRPQIALRLGYTRRKLRPRAATGRHGRQRRLKGG
jgi:hypothetical protein